MRIKTNAIVNYDDIDFDKNETEKEDHELFEILEDIIDKHLKLEKRLQALLINTQVTGE